MPDLKKGIVNLILIQDIDNLKIENVLIEQNLLGRVGPF